MNVEKQNTDARTDTTGPIKGMTYEMRYENKESGCFGKGGLAGKTLCMLK